MSLLDLRHCEAHIAAQRQVPKPAPIVTRRRRNFARLLSPLPLVSVFGGKR